MTIVVTYAPGAGGGPDVPVSAIDTSPASPGGPGPASAESRRSIGNVGTRILRAIIENYGAGASVSTWHNVLSLAQHFDSVRIILINNQTTGTITAGPAKVSVISDYSTAAAQNNNAGTWVSVTWAGATTVTLANATVGTVPTYTFSDWIQIKSVSRTDGIAFPLLAIRVCMPAGNPANISIVSHSGDQLGNWATRADGHNVIMRAQAVDGVTTLANFTATANTQSAGPILGVQYMARGRVMTVASLGDSISEGRGTYIGDGFNYASVNAVSNMSGVAVEYADFGWTGQVPDQFGPRWESIASAFLPAFNVLVYQAWSPNWPPPYTQANEDTNFQMLGRVLASCASVRTLPIFWTGIPCNNAVHVFGTSDSFRTDFNSRILGPAYSSYNVMDFSTPMSGVTSGGQVQLNSLYTTDGIHPNEAGNIGPLAGLLTPILSAILRPLT